TPSRSAAEPGRALEALLAEQRDEPARADLDRLELFSPAPEDGEDVGSPARDRDDEAPPVRQLPEQRPRRRRRRGVHGDRAEGRPQRAAAAAVSVAEPCRYAGRGGAG